MRKHFFFIPFFIAFFLLDGCVRKNEIKVCVKDNCVYAEIANTVALRERGLMFRQVLAENRGMLFVFNEEGRYGFWMENMRFPLDIIWINSNYKIIDIYNDALPCKDICKSMFSQQNAKYVLEVNAGFTEKHHIQIGDRLNF